MNISRARREIRVLLPFLLSLIVAISFFIVAARAEAAWFSNDSWPCRYFSVITNKFDLCSKPLTETPTREPIAIDPPPFILASLGSIFPSTPNPAASQTTETVTLVNNSLTSQEQVSLLTNTTSTSFAAQDPTIMLLGDVMSLLHDLPEQFISADRFEKQIDRIYDSTSDSREELTLSITDAETLTDTSLLSPTLASSTFTGGSIFEGQVAIGTTTFEQQLLVDGNLRTTGWIAPRLTGLNDLAFAVSLNQDTFLPFLIRGSGRMEFGAGGNNPRDLALFRSATGTLRVNPGVLVVDNMIGIGTTSPTEKLTVDGAIYLTDTTPADGSNRLYNQAGDLFWNGSLITSSTTGNWAGSGGDVFRATGNVGIGTTTPQSELHIVQTGGTGALRLSRATAQDALFTLSGNSLGNTVFGLGTSGGGSAPFLLNLDLDTGFIGVATTSPTRRFSVTGDSLFDGDTAFTGNVGIGTTSPTTLLHVAFGASGAPGTATFDNFRIEGGGSTGIDITTPDANTGRLNFGSPSDSRNAAIWASNNSGNPFMAVRIDNVEQARFTEAGFGIGTTSPTSLLDVWGDVRIGTSSVPALLVDTNTNTVGVNTDPTAFALTAAGDIMLTGSSQQIYFGGINTSVGELSNGDSLALRGGGNDTSDTVFINPEGALGLGASAIDFKLEIIGTTTEGYLGVSTAQLAGGDIFKIDNSGNVGIGTTTPTARLTISDTGDQISIIDSDGAQEWRLDADTDFLSIINQTAGTNPLLISDSAPSQSIRINASELLLNGGAQNLNVRMLTDTESFGFFLDATTNFIGIGDGTPSARLNVGTGNVSQADGADDLFVTDDIELDGELFVDGTGDSYFMGNVGIGTTSPISNLGTALTLTGTGQALVLEDTDVSAASDGRLYRLVNQNGSFVIAESGRSGDSTTGSSDLFAISSGGNVGIGTTTPQELLHVYEGNVLLEPGFGLEVRRPSTGVTYDVIRASTGDTASTFDITIGQNSAVIDNILFRPGTTDTMIIEAGTGNVGIGTTSPQSILHVAGGTGSLSTGLTFGDGDTGLYESSDDTITFSFGGSDLWSSSATEIIASPTNGGARIRGGGGTAIAPIYSFTTDTNTGAFWPSADNLGFTTGGSEALRIDASGNVGIGTTTPATLEGNRVLVIEGTAGSELILSKDDTTVSTAQLIGSLAFMANDAGGKQVAGIKSYAAAPDGRQQLEFYTGDTSYLAETPQMTIDRDGNMAIGTTTDGATFDARLYIQSSGTEDILNLFETGGAEVFTVLEGGNVGIGETSPSARLSLGSNTSEQKLLVNESGNFRFGFGTPGSGEFRMFTASGGASFIGFGQIDTDGSTYSEFMRLDASGNLGIGTTSPSSALNIYEDNTNTTDSGLTIDQAGSGDATARFIADGQTYTMGIDNNQDNNFKISGADDLNSAVRFTLDGNSVAISSNDAFGNKLYLANSNAEDGIFINNNSGNDNYVKFGYSNTAAFTIGTDGGDGAFKIFSGDGIGDTNEFVIDADGNVGIGTTTPEAKLSIEKPFGSSGLVIEHDGNNSNGKTALVVRHRGGSGSAGIFLERGASDRTAAIGFGTRGADPADATPEFLAGLYPNVGVGSGYRFSITENISGNSFETHGEAVGNLNERLTVATGGNVGVSVVDPIARFAVQATGTADILNLFEAGGDEVFTVLEGGNVGIGTDSPIFGSGASGLEIERIDDATLRLERTSGTPLEVRSQATQAFIQTRSTGALALGVNGNQLLTIVDGGNVGIGTTSPASSLHVVGDTSTAQGLFDSGSSHVGIIGTASDNNIIDFSGDSLRFRSQTYASRGSNTGTSRLSLSRAGGLSLGVGYIDTEPGAGNMIIEGTVGIGTTSPSAVLDVAGTAEFNDMVTIAQGNLLLVDDGGVVDGHKIGRLEFGHSASSNPYVASDGDSIRFHDDIVFNAGGADSIGASASVNTDLTIQHNRVGQDIIFQMATATNAVLEDILTIESGGDVIFNYGNVGIGTDSPAEPLHIRAAQPTMVRLERDSHGDVQQVFTNSAADIWTIGHDNSLDNFTIAASDDDFATNAYLVIDRATGNLGIGTTTPTASLHASGTIRFEAFGIGNLTSDADGNITVSSDERLKDITNTFDTGLEAILAIEPIQYNWTEDSGLDTDFLYTGFSAQNIELVLPEAVSEDKRGFLTLSDRPILAAVINAIKELWDNLNGRVTELEAENELLKSRLEAIEAELDMDEPPTTPRNTESANEDSETTTEDSVTSSTTSAHNNDAASTTDDTASTTTEASTDHESEVVEEAEREGSEAADPVDESIDEPTEETEAEILEESDTEALETDSTEENTASIEPDTELTI